MFDPAPGVLLWASILSLKSMALVAVLAAALMGPSLWRSRQWWLWILPRHWQKLLSSLSEAEIQRWWIRARIFFWVVFVALAASWISLAYQVTHRE